MIRHGSGRCAAATDDDDDDDAAGGTEAADVGPDAAAAATATDDSVISVLAVSVGDEAAADAPMGKRDVELDDAERISGGDASDDDTDDRAEPDML